MKYKIVLTLRETSPPPPAYIKVICPACKGKNLSSGLFDDTLRECYLCPYSGWFKIENPEYFNPKTRIFEVASILRLFRLGWIIPPN